MAGKADHLVPQRENLRRAPAAAFRLTGAKPLWAPVRQSAVAGSKPDARPIFPGFRF